MKKISLIGAGGHSRSVIGLLANNGFTVENIYDDAFKVQEMIFGIPVLGPSSAIKKYQKLVLAIGDCYAREKYFKLFHSQIHLETITHTTAYIEKYVQLGRANNIFAKVFINNGVEMGDDNLINSGAIIEHEAIIGSHNHISVSSSLLGRSEIGNRCFIGAGAIIKDKVKICDDVIVGANSFVSENINEPGLYVGSPARKVK